MLSVTYLLLNNYTNVIINTGYLGMKYTCRDVRNCCEILRTLKVTKDELWSISVENVWR
jgi:hypothetical protein